jgi:glycosyltransferase involved in cell wall biosynthesis
MTTVGTLDGLTVLRFAHAFESGGGTERYLDDLDSTLLRRNAMTIVRLHLTRQPAGGGPIEERIGRGTLVRIPLAMLAGKSLVPFGPAHPPMNQALGAPVSDPASWQSVASYEPCREAGAPVHGDGSATKANGFSPRSWLKQRVRDWVLYNPVIWSAIGARWVASRRLPHLPGQAVGAGQAAGAVFRNRRVDLVMLHFFGGADAEEVLNEARKAGVPCALLNHYANDRFLNLSIRKHAMAANGVAGVNGLGLPRYVRNGFTNLSDGIDTEFFQRAKARPLENPPAQPILFLPARVVREKGQMDLVSAAAALRRSGCECFVVFAGRVDSSGYVHELQQAIARAGLSGSVRFLGELGLEKLRDWYAASAVVALPTYHHEGLPRVILEAQAMGVPVVAYATGGVADGIESNRTGYLLPTGDVRGLTNRLRELLVSPTLREAMGRSGRVAAETRFSLAALAGRHEQYYARIMAASKAAAAGATGN